MLNITIGDKTYNFELANLLWWLIIGLIAGLLASVITRRRGSIVTDIILGIVGAFVGGFFLSLIGLTTYGTVGTLFAATIGAILLIVVIRAFSYRGRRRGSV